MAKKKNEESMFEREENPQNVTDAEIVVSMASYQEADAIQYPTRQADLGLQKYFGDKTSTIINCDNHSTDGTEEAFMATQTKVPKIYITTPPLTPGKGYNFENMFRRAFELSTKAFVCIDADLESITPEWIKYLGEPLMDEYDYVTPVYSRHKYDGTITNNICFPLVHGLFGKNIRQPIGGDFGISSRLADHLIRQQWHRTTKQYGIDIFMTMNAIIGDFKICSTGLGAKIHKPSAPKLGPMFVQVVFTAFQAITRHVEKWKNVTKVERLCRYGLTQLDSPQELTVDREAIDLMARGSFEATREITEQVLSPGLYAEMSAMFAAGGTIDISTEQWITAVYDSIVAFNRAKDKIAVVEALRGLFFGRSLSFMNRTWDLSSEQAEKEVVEQAKEFFKRRDYLVDKLMQQKG